MIQLRFRAINRDIFEAIRKGKKRVETRAATPKFIKIKTGDVLMFVCGKDGFKKQAKSVKFFKTIPAMLRKYKVQEINPLLRSEKELENMYYSFPGYRKKINRYGLITFELE